MNDEHQLKSKIAWLVCTKPMKLKKNGQEKNEDFYGL